MRYYDIQISDPDSGAMTAEYTSFVNGKTDPNALMIEIDLPVAANAEPTGDVQSYVRIWGIPLTEIAQSHNLNGKAIKVYGGMQKGLPLANPQQAGLLVQGVINQAFGNYILTDQTLELQVYPGTGSRSSPKNIVLNWLKGQPLSTAMQSCLQAAFPGYTVNININPKLVAAQDDQSYYDTLPQLAQYVDYTSVKIIGGTTYTGVQIFVQNKVITVYDSTTQPTAVDIAFTDLIGQITWLDFATLSVTCVMRAKPTVGDVIKLPPGQITVNAASLSQFRQGSVFQGQYMIKSARHVGNSRNPNGVAWCTVYEVSPIQAPS